MLILEKLAKASAILAGMLLTFITIMTCVSLIGRNTTGATLVGDFELTGVAAGAAIALFMPWCQLRRGNIIVDFFTAQAPATRPMPCSTGSAPCCWGCLSRCWPGARPLGGLNA